MADVQHDEMCLSITGGRNAVPGATTIPDDYEFPCDCGAEKCDSYAEDGTGQALIVAVAEAFDVPSVALRLDAVR